MFVYLQKTFLNNNGFLIINRFSNISSKNIDFVSFILMLLSQTKIDISWRHAAIRNNNYYFLKYFKNSWENAYKIYNKKNQPQDHEQISFCGFKECSLIIFMITRLTKS